MLNKIEPLFIVTRSISNYVEPYRTIFYLQEKHKHDFETQNDEASVAGGIFPPNIAFANSSSLCVDSVKAGIAVMFRL